MRKIIFLIPADIDIPLSIRVYSTFTKSVPVLPNVSG